MAMAAHEADICPGCRQPRSRSKHPDMMDHYSIQFMGTCWSCHEWESWREAHKKSDLPDSMQYGLVVSPDAPTDLPDFDVRGLGDPDTAPRTKESPTLG